MFVNVKKNFVCLSNYAAALFQCRSCPGISLERCLALILAKSYPISGRYALVKLHSFTPPIFIPSISDKTKAP